MEVAAREETYELFEIFGQKALITCLRIKRDTIPEGLTAYDLRHGDDGDICSIAQFVMVNHFGTVLVKDPLSNVTKEVTVTENDYNFLGEDVTIDEFLAMGDTITTKDSFGNECTYRIVDKIPAGFEVWNIGQHNMNADEYVPLCIVAPDSEGWRKIDPERILAIKVGKERAALLMEAAGYGVNNISSAEEALKDRSDKKRQNYARRTIEIFREISD